MNAAHLHLLINHIPVLGSLFAFLLLVPGSIKNDRSLIKAGLITVIVAAAFAGWSAFTGEGAEHLVENINAVDKEAMDLHEEFAETATLASYAAGLLAFVTFIAMVKKVRMVMRLVYINVFVIAVVTILMARTAYTGGIIRHSEIHIVPER